MCISCSRFLQRILAPLTSVTWFCVPLPLSTEFGSCVLFRRVLQDVADIFIVLSWLVMYFPLRSQRCVTFPGSHIVYATLAVSRWRQAFLRGACWDFFSSLLSSFVSCLLAAFSFLCLLLSFPLSFKRCDDAVFDHVFFFRLCPSAVLRCRWLRMSNWAICLEPKKMRCIKIRCCFVFEHSQGSSVDSLLGLLWVVWFRYIWMSVNFQLPRYLVLLLIASTESLSHCMLFLPRNL